MFRLSRWFCLFIVGFAVITSAAYAATGSCTSSLNPLPSGAAISDVTPGSLYEGSVMTLVLTGTKLDKTWTVLLCPTTAGATGPPVVGPIDAAKATATALQLLLTAGPGTAGT